MAKGKISKFDKSKVRLRANGLCEYCMSQEKYATHSFSIDHIIPESKGGTSGLENLCLACQGCNNYKYTKTHSIDQQSGERVNCIIHGKITGIIILNGMRTTAF